VARVGSQAAAPGILLSIGAALASAALVTLIGRLEMNGAIAHQEARNKELETEISKLDDQIKEIEGLERQKQALIARMEIIETLQRSRPEIVHVFDELVHVLPEGVYLTYLKQSGSAHRDAWHRAVEHASLDVHAQHRQLRVAGRPVAADRRDEGTRRWPRLELHVVRDPAKQVPVDDEAAGAKKKVAAK
jgi:Tfp pilus assembly protein PilN